MNKTKIEQAQGDIEKLRDTARQAMRAAGAISVQPGHLYDYQRLLDAVALIMVQTSNIAQLIDSIDDEG